MKPLEIFNRKSGRDYHILETLEAGIELRGTEVKSLRNGGGNLNDAFARVEKGELWLYQFHIAPYEMGNRENHDPKRVRRLLVHRHELMKLDAAVKRSGFTLVPLKVYLSPRRQFKVLLGVGKGKTHGDKRQDLKKRDTDQEMRRAMLPKRR